MRAAAALALLLAAASPIGAGMLHAGTLDAAIGSRLFDRQWVGAPASTKAADGLGPFFAAASCAACHPAGGSSARLVARLGNATSGDPVYGRQLQPFAVAGLSGEAGLSLGPLDAATRTSLRRPPALAAAAAIAALGDDAILSGEGRAGGRAARRPDGRIGRFGWKATGATLDEQIAAAFSSDMGLSTSLFPDPHGDCTPAEKECRAAPVGSEAGEPEIADAILATLVAFVRSLAPAPAPAAGTLSGNGAGTFETFGCAACHAPVLRDGTGREARVFSDLLLHDMGPALDDDLSEPTASSSQWRTAPLLGLGRHLAARGRLLHDGRAATIAEAVASHGGDAAFSRAAFLAGSDVDRRTLETYLKGL